MATVLVVLLALLGVVGGLALPASAHDTLTGSAPVDGSTVDTPPASVDLTFSQPPLTIGAEIRVTGPDGQVVSAGDVVITETTVSQPLAGELPAGAYAVVWRVTSGDGHPISGELAFTAAGPSGGTGEPTDGPPTDPTADATADATAEPAPEVTEPPRVTQGGGTGDRAVGDPDESGTSPWVVGAIALGAAALAVAWAASRRAAGGRRD